MTENALGGPAYVESLVAAISEANETGILVSTPGLTGFSGEKVIGVLQRVARISTGPDKPYVEVGVFRGMTLLSVAHAAPGSPVFGIDDFSQFDPVGENQTAVVSRREAISAHNAELINADYEDALERLPGYVGARRVGLYFVDGPHDYRSQLMCLELMRPHLADGAVIVVDDSNYEHVRQANADFLRCHPEFKLLFEAYTPSHPDNMTASELHEARLGWWDGVNILVHDPADLIAPSLPPTNRDRTLYVNEHIVHSARSADLTIEAVALADALTAFNPKRAAGSLLRLFKAARSPDRRPRPPHRLLNGGMGRATSRMAVLRLTD